MRGRRGSTPLSPGQGRVLRLALRFAALPRPASSWPLILAVMVMLVAGACQRDNVTDTPTFPPPPTAVAESLPEAVTGYPPPIVTLPPETSYPVESSPTPAVTPGAASATPRTGSLPIRSYLPFASTGKLPTSTPMPEPSSTPEPTPTPTPTIDFSAVRAELQAQGQDLAFAKIGFHAGPGGNRNGLGDWMHRLDEAGVPFFLKSVDDAGPLFEAQQIVRDGDTPHTLVFRRSGDEYDTPDYSLSPQEAARRHWQLHMAAFPQELDPSVVWLETINEVDKERSEWLAEFAIETSRLALADGFRWAAFGWSSGEPEEIDWRSPAMLEFLRLAAANPDRIAIALHEYSFQKDDIADAYPFKVGRFQQIYQIVDELGIPRPTILITEWGWEYQEVPSIDRALRDIEWAASMYAPYPEIKGAAIWYLGAGFADIADMVQPLIRPVLDYSLGNYFAVPLPPEEAAIAPEQFRP